MENIGLIGAIFFLATKPSTQSSYLKRQMNNGESVVEVNISRNSPWKIITEKANSKKAYNRVGADMIAEDREGGNVACPHLPPNTNGHSSLPTHSSRTSVYTCASPSLCVFGSALVITVLFEVHKAPQHSPKDKKTT